MIRVSCVQCVMIKTHLSEDGFDTEAKWNHLLKLKHSQRI